MKIKRVLPCFLVILLTSCSGTIESKIFDFDTQIIVRLYDGKSNDLFEIKGILDKYDKLADNYRSRILDNVYTINQTNDPVQVDEGLYKMLQKAFAVKAEGAEYFDPLCGSLAKLWKDSLNNKQVLDSATVTTELEKKALTSVEFQNDYYVRRTGESEIDLGGIAKGYALDVVKEYLDSKELKQYIINAGQSSILLGEKNTSDGLFNIGVRDLNNKYIQAKNCFVSTSGVSEQFVEIDSVKYSHIVNSNTGSTVCLYDAVIVLTETGYFGDALATSMMMNTIDEIKAIEQTYGVKALVIKDEQITYQNESIEVLTH